jgi:hypothetical protein
VSDDIYTHVVTDEQTDDERVHQKQAVIMDVAFSSSNIHLEDVFRRFKCRFRAFIIRAASAASQGRFLPGVQLIKGRIPPYVTGMTLTATKGHLEVRGLRENPGNWIQCGSAWIVRPAPAFLEVSYVLWWRPIS